MRTLSKEQVERLAEILDQAIMIYDYRKRYAELSDKEADTKWYLEGKIDALRDVHSILTGSKDAEEWIDELKRWILLITS